MGVPKHPKTGPEERNAVSEESTSKIGPNSLGLNNSGALNVSHEDQEVHPPHTTKKKKRRNKKLKDKSNGEEKIEKKPDLDPEASLKGTENSSVVPDEKALPASLSEGGEAKNGAISAVKGHVPAKTYILPPTPMYSAKTVPLSPRKQAIMRYKRSDERMTEPKLIAEAKGNLRTLVHSTNSVDDDEKYTSLLAHQNMDGKATIFRFESSKVLVFHDQLSTNEQKGGGRLLGHGEFEIFQLHNGDVTYLACGSSFVYPLLPKLKILRINFNQFILPLVNPERYWKIFINTENVQIIDSLEKSLKSLVQYRNLFFGAGPSLLLVTPQKSTEFLKGVPEEPCETLPEALVKPNGHVRDDDSIGVKSIAYSPLINYEPKELKATSLNDDASIPASPNDANESANPAFFSDIFDSIPELPPSAPISPNHHHHINKDFLHFSLSSAKKPENVGWLRQTDNQSVTSAMASFDVKTTPHSSRRADNDITTRHKIHQPKPTKHSGALNFNSNPYKESFTFPHGQQPPHVEKRVPRPKSDSSMDSLLDEYEETAKSVTFTRSRPPSRPPSVLSAAVNYHRGKALPHQPNRDLEMSQYNETFDDEDKMFPSTSLSEYNRARQTRSRRSSRSELYTSGSNWMEPQNGRIPASRSTYSVQSHYDGNRNQALNSAYKQIYRSITQRNLNQLVDDGRSRLLAAPLRNVPSEKGFMGGLSHREGYSEGMGRSRAEKSGDVRLNSADVFKMISEKKALEKRAVEQKKKESGFALRLFGW